MRHLIAILGVLAMLVTLAGPVAPLVAATPCGDASMAKMAMPNDLAPCKNADKACTDPCLVSTNCQNQCGPTAPFVRVDADNRSSPLVVAGPLAADSELLLGTASPVDSPPPRI